MSVSKKDRGAGFNSYHSNSESVNDNMEVGISSGANNN